MAREKRELTETEFSREVNEPLNARSRFVRALLAVTGAACTVVPIHAIAEWKFTEIPRAGEDALPARLAYEVTFDESTFGAESGNHIKDIFSNTKRHGSLVVETSIREPDDQGHRSCGQGFDARQNTTVVEQYKRERRNLVSRLVGEHREYVDLSRVFGEKLVRGEVTGSDERELKLAASLRTYSEDVRLAMATFTAGFDEFRPKVSKVIGEVVPGLDIASLAFSAFTRSYDTQICAETYLALQDLRDVRWIVFHDDEKGAIDTEGIEDRKTLVEHLGKIGGYALFSVDVKDYRCNTKNQKSLRRCRLATQLMAEWLEASTIEGHEPGSDWDFQWEVDFSIEPDLKKAGKGLSALAAEFRLADYIGNYARVEGSTLPTWKVLGAVWRPTSGDKCLEDVVGELTYTSRGDDDVRKLVISNIQYGVDEDYYTLSRGGEQVYPSQKRARRAEVRCRCQRNAKAPECTVPLNRDGAVE